MVKYVFHLYSASVIKEGYDVYGLMDAAGDSTLDAHEYGVKRMLQAGVIPITLESLVSEWIMTGTILKQNN